MPYDANHDTDSRCLDPGPEHSRIFPSLRKFCLMNQEIVEPLLVFCCHGIRVRDTRSCNMVLRMFVSLVPEFGLEPPGSKKSQPLPLFGREPAERTLQDSSPVPPETAAVIREYMSTEVLRACITSFHEPYFVDLQKELASLIAAILVYYMPVTSTPRDVLLSLPNVNPADLERLGAYTAKPGSQTRQQRAVVLDMLKDLKGVSVSEMGKMPRSAGFGDGGASSKKPQRSKMAQAFMMVPEQQPRGVNGGGERGGTPDALDGVANLFDS